MSQSALLKDFAGSFCNQALTRLTNGTKGVALEKGVAIVPFNLTVGDLLLLRIEFGAKGGNAISKQILRVDPAVARTARYQGHQGVCHLAKRLAKPLKKLAYYIGHFKTIQPKAEKLAWLKQVLQQPWDTDLSSAEWGLKQGRAVVSASAPASPSALETAAGAAPSPATGPAATPTTSA